MRHRAVVGQGQPLPHRPSLAHAPRTSRLQTTPQRSRSVRLRQVARRSLVGALPQTSSSSTCIGTTNPCSLVFTGNGGITVTFNPAVNQPPANAVPVAQTTNEDTSKLFSSGGSNQISISDPDAGTATVQVTLTATNGTLTLSGTAGLNFACGGCVGDGTADTTMTFQGTISAINTALNGLSFAPTGNFNGSATLTITTNDLGNTGSGGAKTDTDSVSITVTAGQRRPELHEGRRPDRERGRRSPERVRMGDRDLALGPPTRAVRRSTSSSPTTTTPCSRRSPRFRSTGTLTYTPAANANGSATVSVQIHDNGGTANGGVDTSATQTFTITVNAVNDAPSFTKGADQTVNEDAGAAERVADGRRRSRPVRPTRAVRRSTSSSPTTTPVCSRPSPRLPRTGPSPTRRPPTPTAPRPSRS